MHILSAQSACVKRLILDDFQYSFEIEKFCASSSLCMYSRECDMVHRNLIQRFPNNRQECNQIRSYDDYKSMMDSMFAERA